MPGPSDLPNSLRLPVGEFERRLIILAAVIFSCHAAVALALIPPWQQPDEPTHVAHVELHRNRIALRDGLPDPAREADILQSMAAYDWWKHRGIGWETPPVTPDRFSFFSTSRGRVVVEVVGISNPPAYYRLVGRLFSWLPRRSVVEDLYAFRALSTLLGLLTLLVGWFAARECLGPLGGAVVAVLLALHPQFAIVSTAASLDPAANLLGACVWWQAAVALKRKHILVPLAMVWVTATAAAVADRMGVPLLAMAFVVCIVVAALRFPFRGPRASLTIPMTVVIGAAALGAAALALHTFGQTYGFGRIFSGVWAPVPGAMTWRSFVRFTWLLHQSWWFSLGWRPYLPPFWWTALAAMLTAVAAFGTGRRLFRDKELDSETRTLVALAIIAIAIQAFAVYWTYFRLGNGAQGRYLFPFLVPSLVLLWTGVEAWVPHSRRVDAASALVLLFALLDAAAWTLVAIPAYYATF